MKVEQYRGKLPDGVLGQIAEIYLECFTGPPRFETWTREEVESHIRRFVEGGADIFAVRDSYDQIVSFGIGIPMADYFGKEEILQEGVSEDSYYFAELGTRQAKRGNGYGAEIHRKRELKARERGFSRLSVRVRKDNEVNIKLLERAGFARVAEYQGEIAGARAEKYLLVKDLDSTVSKSANH
ncbi:MAG: GNAT family N-acetyltransferase [Candidatus Obscuribacterales bacterium]|nr:GNAT family N-acetyltransferase [Candidatus Obscuribacterales bacterium]